MCIVHHCTGELWILLTPMNKRPVFALFAVQCRPLLNSWCDFGKAAGALR